MGIQIDLSKLVPTDNDTELLANGLEGLQDTLMNSFKIAAPDQVSGVQMDIGEGVDYTADTSYYPSINQ